MLVSIITISKDQSAELPATIESVARQTYTHIEHVVVDGESKDDTGAVLASYPGVKMLSRAPAGVYDAINHGILCTTGEVIGMVHGGDKLTSDDVVEKVASAFEADPELDFVFGDVRYVDTRTGRTYRVYSANRFRLQMLKIGFAPPHPSLYVRRRVLERIGLYKADYKVAADLDMFVRLFKDKTLHYRYLPITMADMSVGGLSQQWYNRLILNNKEKLRALRENGLDSSYLTIFRRYRIVLKSLLKRR